MELARLAEKRGDYTSAGQYYQKAAAAGKPQAYLALSAYYRSGKLTPPSATAVDDMLILAQNLTLQELISGNCTALPGIAYMLRNNTYDMRNDALAMEWYQAGVKAGDIPSMLMLAEGYAAGYRIPYDMEKAITLWRMAADKGNAKAMYRLGKTLLHDTGGDDITEGITLLTQSAERGHHAAVKELIWYYQSDHQTEEALRWLAYAVEKGYATPTHLRLLGEAYTQGNGVIKNPKKGLSFYRQAAEAGDAAAMVALGKAYKYGWGMTAQPMKSYRFFRRAAAEGNIAAIVELIHNYQCGIGKTASLIHANQWHTQAIYQSSREILKREVTRLFASPENTDHQKAVLLLARWIKKESAAAQESHRTIDRTPMVWMAIAAKHGWGIAQDETFSHEWLKLATTGKGKETGLVAKGTARMEASQLGYNPLEALSLWKEAALLGNTQAAYYLGKTYETGLKEIPANISQAMKYLRMAAEQNHATAEKRLGVLLLREGNRAEGMHWLERAASHGNRNAMLKLAKEAHEEGNQPLAIAWLEQAKNTHPCTLEERAAFSKAAAEINKDHSIEETLKAAEQGDISAIREVAGYYLYQGDAEKALEWYKKAIAKNDGQSMLELGNAYFTGAMGASDAAQARHWWQQAAKTGNTEAAALLRQLPQQ
jgi:TPR repeat protein